LVFLRMLAIQVAPSGLAPEWAHHEIWRSKE